MAETVINFCPRCGTGISLQFKFGKIRPVCPNCNWVYFADPKVAAAVLVRKDERILLVQRNNPPKQGLWTLPAGFVDAGEDPERAAVRECLEETGLLVEVTTLMDVVSGLEHPRGADIVIVYLCQVVNGVLQARDDADQAGWFELSDLPPLAFEATRKIIGNLL